VAGEAARPSGAEPKKTTKRTARRQGRNPTTTIRRRCASFSVFSDCDDGVLALSHSAGCVPASLLVKAVDSDQLPAGRTLTANHSSGDASRLDTSEVPHKPSGSVSKSFVVGFGLTGVVPVFVVFFGPATLGIGGLAGTASSLSPWRPGA